MTSFEGIAASASRGGIGWLGRRLRLWRQRLRDSRELAAMSERDRRDIGITLNDVWRETNKHFWRG